MKRYRRLNWLYLFFAFTLLIVVVAGCGGASPAQPAAASAATVPANAPAQATATPRPAPTPVPPSPTPVPPTPEPTDTPAPSAQPPTVTATAEMQATEPAADSSMAGQPDLPTPADAKDLVYSADAQEVTYTSPSDVKTLVKFYRQALPGQGWEEDETAALVSDNVGSLEFSKGDASLSFTIVSDGAGGDTEVSIDLSGMMAAAGTESPTTTAADQSGTETLTAEDKDGLPVPDNYTNFSSEGSPYRQSVIATSPSALKAVLELYRRELPARKWQEVPGGAGATDTQATLTFENQSEQAHLVLELTRNADGGTDINIATKLEGAAKQAGVLPSSGQARIYLGNITDGQVVFTINQKEIKVGVQSPNPASMKDIPSVDVSPGEYDFTLAIPGQTPIKDKIKVGPDEVWALVAGPGGALPVEMY
jgi:hypothetical protein